MATKRECDRCGAEINPPNSVTYAGIRRIKNDISDTDYELCVSCANKLRKWLNGEEDDNGKWIVRFDGPYNRRRCYCSHCGKHNGVGGIAQNQEKPYCPNCGAKMNIKDGGDNDAVD